MSGIAAVQSRIAEIQSRMVQLSGATPVATTATTTEASFANALAGATGASATGATGLNPTTDLLGAGASGPSGGDLVESAKKYLGVPYLWGGTDPDKGLDCSGFVQRAMKDLGIDIPRHSQEQGKAGTEVPSLAQARPGDLIVNSDPNHIGIYVGDNKMIHAPKAGDVVKISTLWREPDTIRRVMPGEGGFAAAATGATAAAARPAALRSSSFDGLFAAAESRNNLPAGLLSAVAKVESGYNPNAVSPAGALGLMQIMPGTAKGLGVDPRDPAQAVDGAARLLRDHLDTFKSLDLALAAYNAGPGAVRKYDGVPPYAETTAYVRKVTSALNGGS